MNLKSKTNSELVNSAKALVGKERNILADFLLHLIEIEERELHLSLGYSSMFDYLTKGLRFSEPAAARRLRAARCLRDNPKAEVMLRNGELNLTTLCQASVVVKDKNVSLEQFSGVSSRKAELIAAEYKPALKKKLKDTIKPIGKRVTKPKELPLLDSTVGADSSKNKDLAELKHKVSFEAGVEFTQKLEEVKAVLSNKLGAGASLEEVLGVCMEVCLEKHCPKRKALQREKRDKKKDLSVGFNRRARENEISSSASSLQEASKPDFFSPELLLKSKKTKPQSQKKSAGGRHIPARLRDEVMRRDDYQCTFTGEDGKQCRCRRNLEIDHIVPFAVGGKTEPGNLRVLCRAHNQFEARQKLSKGVVNACIKRAKAA